MMFPVKASARMILFDWNFFCFLRYGLGTEEYHYYSKWVSVAWTELSLTTA